MVQNSNMQTHPIPPPSLDKAGKKFIQEVMGVFLYLAQAVDLTNFTPLSAIVSKQAAPIEKTMQKYLQFLDCAASQEDAIVTYQASDMRHTIHKDTSYLSEPKARATCSWQAQKTSPSTMEQYSLSCR
jgi:hypothetical protein